MNWDDGRADRITKEFVNILFGFGPTESEKISVDDTTDYDVTPHVATTVAGVTGVYMLSIDKDLTKEDDYGPLNN